jgi:hypothetical protein
MRSRSRIREERGGGWIKITKQTIIWISTHVGGSHPSPFLLPNEGILLVFLDPSVDPKTLCPYCDSPLPFKPSPLLERLISAISKKSRRDPRPSNPLGHKAPLSVFIAVCQRHAFEAEILPEAEARGWPKEIEWRKLEGRVKSMADDLRALIDDENGLGSEVDGVIAALPSGGNNILDFVDDGDDDERSPKVKCVFWLEVVKDIKSGGAKVINDVRSQFARFDKAQPG